MDDMDYNKVSIIVPVYNAESYLERCIGSLTAQTYPNTEIILVEDGSTDASGRMCDTFSLKYDKIKVLHVPNAGVSAARNRGIDEASGDYLTFVDADDYAEEDMTACLVRMMEQTGSDIAGCGYHSFSREAGPEYAEKTDGQREKEEYRQELLSGSEFIEQGILAGDTRCWSKLYRAEIVGGSRFDTELTIGEDMLFLLELIQKGAKVCRSSYKGYGYFINESGAMNRGFRESYMDQIICWQQAADRIVEREPGLRAKVTAILMISTMLVVGKLAVLSGEERKKYAVYITICSEQIKECGRVQAAYKELPAGYRVKVAVYRICPKLYMRLYYSLKRMRQCRERE